MQRWLYWSFVASSREGPAAMNHESGVLQRQNGSGKIFVTYNGAYKKTVRWYCGVRLNFPFLLVLCIVFCMYL